MNPSADRTLGNCRSRSEIHFGVERRAARREEEVRVTAGETAEELLITFWLPRPREGDDDGDRN